MIDTSRWILVETWLSLGLRMRWSHNHFNDSTPWQNSQGGGRRFCYDGNRVWIVERRSGEKAAVGFSDFVAPEMTIDDMLHELAHWIAATKDQRELVNFGMVEGQPNDEMEDRALIVEQGLQATIRAANNIAQLAMGAKS